MEEAGQLWYCGGIEVGRIMEKVRIQNYADIFDVSRGQLEEAKVRTAEVEAVVDTGATYLCLPPPVIRELGLLYSHSRPVQTANGIVERRIFRGAEITIKGRTEEMSVMENDETTPGPDRLRGAGSPRFRRRSQVSGTDSQSGSRRQVDVGSLCPGRLTDSFNFLATTVQVLHQNMT